MNKVIYRCAVPDDAENISMLLDLVVNEKSNATILDCDITAGISREVIKNLSPRASYMVAEQASTKKLIGLLTTEPYSGHLHNYDHVTLMAIYVSTEFQRKGIGTKLLYEGLNLAKNAGFEKIFTYLRTDNIKAIRFVNKHGFRIIGTTYDFVKKDDIYFNGILIEKKI